VTNYFAEFILSDDAPQLQKYPYFANYPIRYRHHCCSGQVSSSFAMTKVSLVYAKTGGGHFSLAQAIKQILGNIYFYELFDPFPNSYTFLYTNFGSKHKTIYNLAYRLFNLNIFSRFWHIQNYQVIKKQLFTHLKRFTPDILITNHSLAGPELIWASNTLGLPNKTVFFLPDLLTTLDSWFVGPQADLYLSPTEEVKALAVSHGISPKKIVVCGWPVRSQFTKTQTLDKNTVLSGLGFSPNKFTVFLGGSGMGINHGSTLIRLLSQEKFFTEKCQLIYNPGYDHKSISSLLNSPRNYPGNVLILPIISDPAPLYSCSDLVIGKAGPNFIFENITLGKPVFIVDYVPGQETPNLKFIKDNKLGWIETCPSKTVLLIKSIVENPDLIKKFQPSIEKYKSLQLNTAKIISSEINRLVFSR
jgi:UDP-N-acetylglucosamine:LPS N-acetylglucosamine transferase